MRINLDVDITDNNTVLISSLDFNFMLCGKTKSVGLQCKYKPGTNKYVKLKNKLCDVAELTLEVKNQLK